MSGWDQPLSGERQPHPQTALSSETIRRVRGAPSVAGGVCARRSPGDRLVLSGERFELEVLRRGCFGGEQFEGRHGEDGGGEEPGGEERC